MYIIWKEEDLETNYVLPKRQTSPHRAIGNWMKIILIVFRRIEFTVINTFCPDLDGNKFFSPDTKVMMLTVFPYSWQPNISKIIRCTVDMFIVFDAMYCFFNLSCNPSLFLIYDFLSIPIKLMIFSPTIQISLLLFQKSKDDTSLDVFIQFAGRKLKTVRNNCVNDFLKI